MKPLLLVKTGSTLPIIAADHGDFEDWFVAGLGVDPSCVQLVQAHLEEPLPGQDEVCGVLVTGSPAMVTDREPWSERAAAWLARAVQDELPVLGVCFGHQLLAHCMGGEVGDCPGGAEVGTVPVTLAPRADDDPLFGGLPGSFPAQTTHWEAVLQPPPGAVALATTAQDTNHAFRLGPRAWGIQYHPEFTPEIMRCYIRERRDKIIAAGQDPDAANRGVSITPQATSVLPRFAALCV